MLWSIIYLFWLIGQATGLELREMSDTHSPWMAGIGKEREAVE